MKLRNIIFAAAVFCLIGFSGNAWGQTQTGSDGDWEFTYSTNDWTATVTEY